MSNRVNYQLVLEKTLSGLEGRTPSLLLHACCAPCSSYVLEYLSQYFSITVFYYNPNISPEEEYQKRVAEVKRFIGEFPAKRPVSLLEGPYEPERFAALSKGLEDLPEGGERCFRCYSLRLRETALLAKERGFDYFTTTLSISPYKNAEKLNEIGLALEKELDVNYLCADFKKKGGYLRSIALSGEYGLYRQSYCGCVFSKREAERKRTVPPKERETPDIPKRVIFMDSIEQLSRSFRIDETTLPIMAQIAEGIPGGFFIYHAKGDQELLYHNHAMPRIFGCGSDEEFLELIHNSFKGIVYPDDYEDVEKSINRQIAASKFSLDYVEYRIRRKDGSIRWVEDYGRFLHTEEYGDIFYVFLEDATDRMARRMSELEEINRELRRACAQETQYKKAILHDAVIFFEVDLTKDEFITSAAQVVGGKVLGLFDYIGIPHFTKYTEYVAYWAHHIRDTELAAYYNFFNLDRLRDCCARGDLEQIFDSWTVDMFGKKRLYRYTFLLGRSEITGDIIALAITKDITSTMEQQRLFQIVLEQSQASNIARSAFLSSMSHDIKTPLNAIIGYAELMRGHSEEKSKILDYVEKIKLAAEQLHNILDESLELTRMESGKAVLSEGACDLSDILAEVSGAALSEAKAKGLYFILDDKGISHPFIVADALRIKEILRQLLDNAVKYTQKGGVFLTVSESENAPQGYALYEFQVRDTGTGMGEGFLNHLFDPFSRENNSTISGVFGSGLGLSVVKSLVDMMNGDIQLESHLGEGSCFTVSLVFRLQDAPSAPIPEEEPDVDLKGKRLLLVEDNAINREIEGELLTNLGLAVDTAENGSEGLAKVRDNPPGTYDVILMDIQMPVMDGYASTRAIRALHDPVRSSIPIIAVSANTFSEDQARALEAGMNAHCPKPVDSQGLYNIITRVLSHQV